MITDAHDDHWRSMMSNDQWWLLMVSDDHWWSIMIMVSLMIIVMIQDDRWWSMMIIDDHWWLLGGGIIWEASGCLNSKMATPLSQPWKCPCVYPWVCHAYNSNSHGYGHGYSGFWAVSIPFILSVYTPQRVCLEYMVLCCLTGARFKRYSSSMLGRTLQRFEPMRLIIMLENLRNIISDCVQCFAASWPRRTCTHPP
jgi:hypothetical protein